MNKIIEVKNLCYKYDNNTALDNLNISIEKGKITTILGSNGAGKSTLFLNLNGVLKPDSGDIIIDGEKLVHKKEELIKMRKNVGIVFQDPDDQLFSADVFRDISFGALNLGLDNDEVKRRVEFAMERTGVSHLRERPTHALSYGQKKRVAIAGVLVMEPKVIILDEPTAGLDPSGVKEIMELLSELKKDKEITIIISTHEIDLVPEYSDYVYIMNSGRVVGEGTPEEIFKDEKLILDNNLKLPIICELKHYLKKNGIELSEKILLEEVKKEFLDLYLK